MRRVPGRVQGRGPTPPAAVLSHSLRAVYGAGPREVQTREWYRGITVRVYLDYNATAPVPAEVADAVSAALRDCPGNASSIHAFGQRAKALLDEARSSVARSVAPASSWSVVLLRRCSGWLR